MSSTTNNVESYLPPPGKPQRQQAICEWKETSQSCSSAHTSLPKIEELESFQVRPDDLYYKFLNEQTNNVESYPTENILPPPGKPQRQQAICEWKETSQSCSSAHTSLPKIEDLESFQVRPDDLYYNEQTNNVVDIISSYPTENILPPPGKPKRTTENILPSPGKPKRQKAIYN